jgi:hypothetical protein
MSGLRWNIEAFAGPTRAPIGDGRLGLTVRARPFDEPEATWSYTRPDAYTDLRTGAGRDLAFELLAAAEHAEHLTRHEDDWESWR